MGQQHLNTGTPNGQNGDFVRDAMNKIESNFNELYNQETGVIDVGAEWSGGLSFDVSANSFPVNGVWYTATEQSLTLDAADGTFDRIDLFVADVFGTISKITGEISGSNPAEPDYDYERQFPIKFVLVQAGATIPSEFEEEMIFNEDLGEPNEWTFVPTTGVAVSTANSHLGTKSIEGSSTLQQRIRFENLESIETSKINSISFWYKAKESYGIGGKIFVYFGQERSAISVPVPVNSVTIQNGQYGYDSTSQAWQKITIDMSRINLSLSFINTVEIKPYKPSTKALDEVPTGTTGYFIDEIKMQLQIAKIVSEPDPTPKNTSSFVNDGAGEVDGSGNVLKYLTSDDLEAVPANTSDITNDGADGTSTYVEHDEIGATATSNDYADLDNKPGLGAVATSNDYGDLDNLPGLGAVATSNDYADLSNLPAIINDLSKVWSFSTSTAGTNPGTGFIRTNNIVPASVTQINISNDTKQGIDVSAYLLSLQEGDVVYIQQAGDATKYILATLTAKITDLTGYWRMQISVNESGVVMDNSADVQLCIYKAGSPDIVQNVESIKEVKITVTPAEMLDLIANPKQMVPAAGAGIVTKIIAITGFVDFNSVPYDFTTNFEFYYETSGIVINVGTQADVNSAIATPFDIDKTGASGGLLSPNEAVMMRPESGVDATVGDSDVKYVILYAEQNFNF